MMSHLLFYFNQTCTWFLFVEVLEPILFVCVHILVLNKTNWMNRRENDLLVILNPLILPEHLYERLIFF